MLREKAGGGARRGGGTPGIQAVDGDTTNLRRAVVDALVVDGLDDVRLRPDDLERRHVLTRDGVVANLDALAQTATLQAIAELQAALES